MRACLLVLCLQVLGLAACGEGSTLAACYLDALASADTVATTYVDCGSYSRGSDLYTDAAMVAAQRCVLNAITRKQGFILLYDANDTAGQSTAGLRAGFTGIVRGGRLVLRAYGAEGDPATPTSMKFVTARSCERLDATDSCKPTVGVSCLQCFGVDLGSIICRG